LRRRKPGSDCGRSLTVLAMFHQGPASCRRPSEAEEDHHERHIGAALGVLALTGCATVVNETTHPIKIETLTQQGAAVPGAECRLTNADGTTQARSAERDGQPVTGVEPPAAR